MLPEKRNSISTKSLVRWYLRSKYQQISLNFSEIKLRKKLREKEEKKKQKEEEKRQKEEEKKAKGQVDGAASRKKKEAEVELDPTQYTENRKQQIQAIRDQG